MQAEFLDPRVLDGKRIGFGNGIGIGIGIRVGIEIGIEGNFLDNTPQDQGSLNYFLS